MYKIALGPLRQKVDTFLCHLAATLIQDAATFANRCLPLQNISLSNQLGTIAEEIRNLRGSDKLARRIVFPEKRRRENEEENDDDKNATVFIRERMKEERQIKLLKKI